jgi:hypothetical protein
MYKRQSIIRRNAINAYTTELMKIYKSTKKVISEIKESDICEVVSKIRYKRGRK